MSQWNDGNGGLILIDGMDFLTTRLCDLTPEQKVQLCEHLLAMREGYNGTKEDMEKELEWKLEAMKKQKIPFYSIFHTGSDFCSLTLQLDIITRPAKRGYGYQYCW